MGHPTTITGHPIRRSRVLIHPPHGGSAAPGGSQRARDVIIGELPRYLGCATHARCVNVNWANGKVIEQ